MPGLPLRYFQSSLQDLVRALPLRALIPLALAIFSLFALLGPVTDVLSGGTQPVSAVLHTALFSGSVALGYAFGSMRRQWRVLVVTAAVQIVWITLSRRGGGAGHAALPPERIREQLTFDAFMILILMVASYSCFLWFINDDELVEVTPKSIRLRKRVLASNMRPKRSADSE